MNQKELLKNIMEKELEVQVKQYPSKQILSELLYLYNVAVQHYEKIQKKDHVRMFIKKIDHLLLNIDCSSKCKQQIDFQVDLAVHSSKQGAKNMISCSKSNAQNIQKIILQQIQSQKRYISQKLAKRKQKKTILRYGQQMAQLKELNKQQQQLTTKATYSHNLTNKQQSRKQSSQDNQQIIKIAKKHRSKKSKYRIMKDAQSNDIPLQLLPF